MQIAWAQAHLDAEREALKDAMDAHGEHEQRGGHEARPGALRRRRAAAGVLVAGAAAALSLCILQLGSILLMEQTTGEDSKVPVCSVHCLHA